MTQHLLGADFVEHHLELPQHSSALVHGLDEVWNDRSRPHKAMLACRLFELVGPSYK